MKIMKTAALLTVLLATSTAVTLVWAGADIDTEAMELANTNIPLTQAVDAALAAVPGKALSAELKTEHERPVYLVEVVNGEKTYEVKVDTQNGRVLGKDLDKPDRDRDHEDEDRD